MSAEPYSRSPGTRRVAVWAVALVALLAAASGQAAAAPPPPSGPHPRLFLDAPTTAALRTLAGKRGSAVATAIARCSEIAREPRRFAHDLYMALDWAQTLQSCLIAYAGTGDQHHAATALVYFKAMLFDLENVGDGKGGDAAAQRDSGFAMRAMGPYTALAYDWLHDVPGMTEELRATARQRFKAWTDWYVEKGYMVHTPGANYHAGWLWAATAIAIAEAGEAGADGDALWRLVTDELWGRDMTAGFQPGGVLDGGDWGEGWQYGPLSVAEYALAGRALAAYGVDVAALGKWLEAILQRHVHALTPGREQTFVGGDTGNEEANLPPSPLTLRAVIAGPASPTAQAWAQAEVDRLHLGASEVALIVDALADVRGVAAQPFPRDATPGIYVASGTSTLYARTGWSKDAVWLAGQCSSSIGLDHAPPVAGNLVLTRGSDDLIVDPAPYGSLSTLTSNAPTVKSGVLPPNYLPSQAFWATKTRWAFARQTASRALVARCDYADQFKIQETPSDVALAWRDIVLVPYDGGASAVAIVVDRARTPGADNAMFLRFRTRARLAMLAAAAAGAAGEVGARGTLGASSLALRLLRAGAGKPELRQVPKGDCFGEGTTQGGCDAARFPVDEYRLEVAGPLAQAIHVIDVAPASASLPAAATALAEGKGAWAAVLQRGGEQIAVVIRPDAAAGSADAGALTYQVPAAAGLHVVLDAPAGPTGRSLVTATRDGAACAVTVKPSPGQEGFEAPVVVRVGADCALKEDPTLAAPRPIETAATPPVHQLASDKNDGADSDGKSRRRRGCRGCATGGGVGAGSLTLALATAAGLRHRRRRPARRELP